MINKMFTKKPVGLLASLLAVISLLLVAATPAFARTMSSSISIRDNVTADKLVNEFQQDRDLASRYARDLKADQRLLTDSMKTMDDTEKSDFRLGSAHKVALLETHEGDIYNQDKAALSEVRFAQGLEPTVQAMLQSAAGFNKNGDVTNTKLASETVKSMDSILAQIRFFIDHANIDLIKTQSGA